MNSMKQYGSTKNRYNCEEILANNYVSIFNSHDFFIQINRSN